MLLSELGQELRNVHVQHVVEAMEHSGILAALDESPEITFGELRRHAIPLEDVDFLAHADVDEPDAEITILLHYARRRLGSGELMPSTIAHQAEGEL